MISYLNGEVLKREEDFIIFLTKGGIGFKIFVPYPEKIKNEIYTSLFISEKEINLYGFLTFEEVNLFEKLIKLPQVGPKSLLQIFKFYTIDEIYERIKKGEPLLVKGVRKKILEEIYEFLSEEIEALKVKDKKTLDAIKILMSLGFEKDEIIEAIRKVNSYDKISLEDYVKEILKVIKNE
ncbi:MAG: OB-fold domain-containing protein [Caldisericia bacterium]|nr:OB-fold domain-containing protein [Caldisericia bacterium]